MADYQSIARAKARKYGLAADIFVRQIRQESGFNPHAVSPAGAQGIAQIMPATAKGWGVNPSDPVASLDAAAKNMARYVKQYGSYRDALVAYNAGPGRVGHSLPAETQRYIANILGGSNPSPGVGTTSSPGTTTTTSTTSITPQADQGRRAALASFVLSSGKPDPVALAQQVAGFNAQTQTTKSVKATPASGGISAPSTGDVKAIFERAVGVDAQHLPYQWGGGHGPTPAKPGVPLDCSGAVSKVLNVSPRVSGQFTTFGAPGKGKSVTIYANGHHVLMEIAGHFWGTSSTNPGGGAGWIKRSAISPGYLKGFVARHPPGL